MCAVWTRRSGVQLAYPMDLKKLSRFPLPWIVQPKLNGERCRVLVRRGVVSMLSSEENDITTLPHIISSLESLRLPDVELDGEIYLHGMSKQEIGSYLRRKEPKPGFERLEYHVFDLVDSSKQIERLELLYAALAPRLRLYSTCVRIIESHPITSYKDLTDILSFFISERYEGLVVRNPEGLYERKRTTNMLKWKPRHKDSYKIVGFEEEVDQFNTPKAMLGAIWCEKDGERFKVSAGGFTHSQRQYLWDNRELLPEKWLLVKYPELTDRGVPNHAVALEITDEEIQDEPE